MASTISRRSLMKGGAALAAGGPLTALLANRAAADPGGGKGFDQQAPDNGGYGPLMPKAADNDGITHISLPAGFSYVAVGKVGEPMADGTPTPNLHDGSAVFAVPGRTDRVVMVRNHEQAAGPAYATPAYSAAAAGGTTNMVYDLNSREVVATYPSLAGTYRNCAGGPTPWGSWLSCEETNAVTGDTQHGYIFEVPSSATSAVDPQPLKAMGAFVHEAVAIDPGSGIVYETEDRGTAGFYRFIPTTPGDLAAGGRLEMLAVKARPNYDTRTGQRVGKPLPVEWVLIDDPDPASYAVNSLAVYEQGFAKGGATFARLEGAWTDGQSIYFNSTSGGDAGEGQVWEYRARGASGGQLILTFESPNAGVLDNPDNITVSPSGALLLCEDGGGTDFLRGISRRGQIFDFSQNLFNNAEWAGAAWTPDGSTLLVNRQSPGVTFAITGPFEQGAL